MEFAVQLYERAVVLAPRKALFGLNLMHTYEALNSVVSALFAGIVTLEKCQCEMFAMAKTLLILIIVVFSKEIVGGVRLSDVIKTVKEVQQCKDDWSELRFFDSGRTVYV